jgi:hypothetical protein
MTKLAFALAAAAALGVATPASAQGLYAGVGDGSFIGVDYYGPYSYGGWGESYGDGYHGNPHYYSPGYGYGYSYSPGYSYGDSPGYGYSYSPGYGYSPGYAYGYYPYGW